MTVPAANGRQLLRQLLGQRLQDLREQAGLTQRQLAAGIGYSVSTIKRAENYGDGARELFAAAGHSLGAGDDLGLMHDQIAGGDGVITLHPPGPDGRPLTVEVHLNLVVLPADRTDEELPGAHPGLQICVTRG
jgi:hypothetical protein